MILIRSLPTRLRLSAADCRSIRPLNVRWNTSRPCGLRPLLAYDRAGREAVQGTTDSGAPGHAMRPHDTHGAMRTPQAHFAEGLNEFNRPTLILHRTSVRPIGLADAAGRLSHRLECRAILAVYEGTSHGPNETRKAGDLLCVRWGCCTISRLARSTRGRLNQKVSR